VQPQPPRFAQSKPSNTSMRRVSSANCIHSTAADSHSYVKTIDMVCNAPMIRKRVNRSYSMSTDVHQFRSRLESDAARKAYGNLQRHFNSCAAKSRAAYLENSVNTLNMNADHHTEKFQMHHDLASSVKSPAKATIDPSEKESRKQISRRQSLCMVHGDRQWNDMDAVIVNSTAFCCGTTSQIKGNIRDNIISSYEDKLTSRRDSEIDSTIKEKDYRWCPGHTRYSRSRVNGRQVNRQRSLSLENRKHERLNRNDALVQTKVRHQVTDPSSDKLLLRQNQYSSCKTLTGASSRHVRKDQFVSCHKRQEKRREANVRRSCSLECKNRLWNNESKLMAQSTISGRHHFMKRDVQPIMAKIMTGQDQVVSREHSDMMPILNTTFSSKQECEERRLIFQSEIEKSCHAEWEEGRKMETSLHRRSIDVDNHDQSRISLPYLIGKTSPSNSPFAMESNHQCFASQSHHRCKFGHETSREVSSKSHDNRKGLLSKISFTGLSHSAFGRLDDDINDQIARPLSKIKTISSNEKITYSLPHRKSIQEELPDHSIEVDMVTRENSSQKIAEEKYHRKYMRKSSIVYERFL
jgi:hypothetical protein